MDLSPPYMSTPGGIYGRSACTVHALRNYLGERADATGYRDSYTYLLSHNRLRDFLGIFAAVTAVTDPAVIAVPVAGYYVAFILRWGIPVEHIFIVKGAHIYNLAQAAAVMGTRPYWWHLDSVAAICRRLEPAGLIAETKDAAPAILVLSPAAYESLVVQAAAKAEKDPLFIGLQRALQSKI
jgi:hypothetical protein